MKAIQTKYLPCTNTKPARIKAYAEGLPSHIWTVNSLEEELLTAGLPDNAPERHKLAARKLAAIVSWNHKLISGGLPDGTWAHTLLPETVSSSLELADSLFDMVSCSERFDGLRKAVKLALKYLG